MLKLITAPATEPVSLEEAKLHLRVEHTADDDLITALIRAAREQAEHELGRALITQTWERVLDAFPAAELELGKPPVQSITSITYTDENEDSQTLSSSLYSLDSDTEPGWVLPAIDTDWPDTLDTTNAVRVRFVCGYGAADDVPEAIKAWIKIRLATMYKMREQFVAGVSVSEVGTNFIDRLLDPYRFYG